MLAACSVTFSSPCSLPHFQLSFNFLPSHPFSSRFPHFPHISLTPLKFLPLSVSSWPQRPSSSFDVELSTALRPSLARLQEPFQNLLTPLLSLSSPLTISLHRSAASYSWDFLDRTILFLDRKIWTPVPSSLSRDTGHPSGHLDSSGSGHRWSSGASIAVVVLVSIIRI